MTALRDIDPGDIRATSRLGEESRRSRILCQFRRKLRMCATSLPALNPTGFPARKTVISITRNSHWRRGSNLTESWYRIASLFASVRGGAIPPSCGAQLLSFECKTRSKTCSPRARKGGLDEAYFCNQTGRHLHSFFIPFCVTHHTRKRYAADRERPCQATASHPNEDRIPARTCYRYA